MNLVIIGGGIIGMSTAMQTDCMSIRTHALALLEKKSPARPVTRTGHNSGVNPCRGLLHAR